MKPSTQVSVSSPQAKKTLVCPIKDNNAANVLATRGQSPSEEDAEKEEKRGEYMELKRVLQHGISWKETTHEGK